MIHLFTKFDDFILCTSPDVMRWMDKHTRVVKVFVIVSFLFLFYYVLGESMVGWVCLAWAKNKQFGGSYEILLYSTRILM